MLKVVYCPRNDDNNFLTLATSETEWSLKEWKRKFLWYSSEVEYMVSLILTYIYSILQWCIICSRVQKKPLGSIWMFHQLWVASFMVTMKTCCQGQGAPNRERTRRCRWSAPLLGWGILAAFGFPFRPAPLELCWSVPCRWNRTT